MKSILGTIIGVALLAGGCRSVGISTETKASVIGCPVQSVILAHVGLRTEMFNKEGEKVEELPQQKRGSVSIYNIDQTAQDNYTFDESGLVVKHLRSYGTNYVQGVWEEVE